MLRADSDGTISAHDYCMRQLSSRYGQFDPIKWKYLYRLSKHASAMAMVRELLNWNETIRGLSTSHTQVVTKKS